ncbi:MAG TPA: hypothetical protein VML01_10280 [Bryobacterales bacterium]|nr:hypothetical protein [Bryobacterales bacterium]
MTANAKSPSIRSTVARWIEESAVTAMDAEQLAELETFVRREMKRVKPVSRSYLLDILSHTEMPIARSLGGLPVDLRHRVKFADAEQAARSLAEMQDEYQKAKTNGDAERAADCRRAVRQGKERLQRLLNSANLPAAKRAEKEEIAQWFLVWLESPGLFRDWLKARTRLLDEPISENPPQPD